MISETPGVSRTPKGNTRTMSQLLDLAVFPGTQGGPLEHIIAAKAIAFREILSDEFTSYARQILSNAQAMAKAFVSRGYNLISSGTDNHLMLIDLRNKRTSRGKSAGNTSTRPISRLNKMLFPLTTNRPSSLRVSGGCSAITTRGLKEGDMETIVSLIDRVLMNTLTMKT